MCVTVLGNWTFHCYLCTSMEILENMEVLFKRASKEPTKNVIHNKRWVIKATLAKRVDNR